MDGSTMKALCRLLVLSLQLLSICLVVHSVHARRYNHLRGASAFSCSGKHISCIMVSTLSQSASSDCRSSVSSRAPAQWDWIFIFVLGRWLATCIGSTGISPRLYYQGRRRIYRSCYMALCKSVRIFYGNRRRRWSVFKLHLELVSDSGGSDCSYLWVATVPQEKVNVTLACSWSLADRRFGFVACFVFASDVPTS